MRTRTRLLLGLLALLLVGVVLLGLGGWWLLRSEGGRDFALARLHLALGEHVLRYDAVSGDLQRGLRFSNLRLLLGEVELLARDAEVRGAIRPLLGRRVQVQQLILRGVVLRLPPPSDTEAGATPFELPELRLPVALQVDSLRIEDATLWQAQTQRLAIVEFDLAGALEDGQLDVRSLRLESDLGVLELQARADTAARWDSELHARLRGPAPDAPWARLQVRGSMQSFTLDLLTETTPAAELHLQRNDARLALQLQADGFDPTPWWPAWTHGVVHADVSGSGSIEDFAVSGELGLDAQRLRLAPSRLGWSDPVLGLRPLHVLLDGGGEAIVEGELHFVEPAPRLEAQLRLVEVSVPGDTPMQLDGSLRVSGSMDDYRADGELQARRAQETAQLSLQGRGSTARFEFAQLRLRTGAGRAEGSGSVVWAPAIAWDLQLVLQGLDPGWLAADFPGELHGALQTAGTRTDAGWQGRLDLQELHGTVRGRTLAAHGNARLDGERVQADLDVALGGSQLQLRGEGDAGQMNLDAQLAPLLLSDLLPGAAGRVQGSLQLRGTRAAPDLVFELDGQALRWQTWAVDALRARGRIAGAQDGPLQVTLDATSLQLGGQAFDTAQLQVEGTRSAHRLQLAASAPRLQIDTELAGALHDPPGWSGQLRRLDLQVEQAGAWRLAAPAALSLDAQVVQLGQACLVQAQARLCAQADVQDGQRDLQLRLHDLPLALFAPLMPAPDGAPLLLSGNIAGELDYRQADDAEQGRLLLSSASGALQLEGAEPALLEWSAFSADAQLAAGRIELRSQAQLGEQGRFELQLGGASPLTQPDGALQGRLQVRIEPLRVVELFTSELAGVQGRLEADLRLHGSWSKPGFDGSAGLEGFAAELPALGVRVRDSHLRLREAEPGQLGIDGVFRVGDQRLTVAGDLLHGEAPLRAQLRVQGTDVLLIDTTLARARVSPDLRIDYTAERLRLRGRVEVPSARIALEEIETSVRTSPDVVIVDPEDEVAQRQAVLLDTDLQIELGDAVELRGFGLQGRVEGKLRVRERPGRSATGTGTLDVSGRYRAYGQDLTIRRGRLLYASSPLDNPRLDVRAEREFDEVVVGVRVEGTALQPIATVYSTPPLDQAEALSYLVLGRPLQSATSAEGAQLTQAAAAFGGNLLAKQMGARMGLDTFEIAQSRTLGGAAFMVGKYLSPKLYLAYGTALFGTGSVMTLKYLMTKQWTLEVEAGVENQASINYRIER